MLEMENLDVLCCEFLSGYEYGYVIFVVLSFSLNLFYCFWWFLTCKDWFSPVKKNKILVYYHIGMLFIFLDTL